MTHRVMTVYVMFYALNNTIYEKWKVTQTLKLYLVVSTLEPFSPMIVSASRAVAAPLCLPLLCIFCKLVNNEILRFRPNLKSEK